MPKILIVDDERNIRLMLRTTLQAECYRICEAASAQEALDSIRREKPDLVLLDLRMPGGDGMSVLEELSQYPAEERPRVIVLTAHGGVPQAVKAVRLGASDFLEKPTTPEDLRLSVASALQERRDQAQPG